jgi:hypothetical protein
MALFLQACPYRLIRPRTTHDYIAQEIALRPGTLCVRQLPISAQTSQGLPASDVTGRSIKAIGYQVGAAGRL